MPASEPRPAVLYYCHHSVGLGHLVRSLAVAGALAGRYRVVLCSGGRVPAGIAVPPGVEIVALPPIGVGPEGGLVSQEAGLTLEEARAARTGMLLRCLEQVAPEVLMVELFPFGRRKFASELIPLLQAARSAQRPPLVISSVRDLLVSGHPDKQHHDDEAAGRLDAYFDAVIVHGDPRFARLEETFHPTVPAAVPVMYSGFVSARTAPPAAEPADPPQVVVSAGGGLLGAGLFTAAAEAHRAILRHRKISTRLVTGPFLPDADFDRLQREAGTCEGLSVERFVPDLCTVMAGSVVTVSQCGYNTSLDILLAGTPAVVVPYGDGREDEQSERARRLAALGAVDVLVEAELSPEALAGAVLRLAGRPRRPPAVEVRGAARTAELVASLTGPGSERPGPSPASRPELSVQRS